MLVFYRGTVPVKLPCRKTAAAGLYERKWPGTFGCELHLQGGAHILSLNPCMESGASKENLSGGRFWKSRGHGVIMVASQVEILIRSFFIEIMTKLLQIWTGCVVNVAREGAMQLKRRDKA